MVSPKFFLLCLATIWPWRAGLALRLLCHACETVFHPGDGSQLNGALSCPLTYLLITNMSYPLPTNAGQLLGLANKMEGGLTELGQKLGITQITAAGFQTYITAFENADNAFNAGRSARQADSDAYQSDLAAMDDWLTVTKNVLVARFGIRWSTAWAQAGFINNTTQIPAKIEDRIALAGRLVACFTANPSYEVPSMLVTAAQGATLQDAVQAAQLALTNAVRALAKLGQTWTDAYAALTNQMWLLIRILQALLNADDPHWLAFGLPMPATPSSPGSR